MNWRSLVVQILPQKMHALEGSLQLEYEDWDFEKDERNQGQLKGLIHTYTGQTKGA